MISSKLKAQTRKTRTRSKIRSINLRPRLNVFRSNQHIFAQIIDDAKAKTLVSAGSINLKPPPKTKIAAAQAVGQLIATRAKKQKVLKVVFDRGAYQYHGRVKALAQSARKSGLKF